MIYDKNSYCKRCGNCCRGMIWKKKFSFNEAFKLAKGKTDKKSVEEVLISHHKQYLEVSGIPAEKTVQVDWDKERRIICTHIKVGRCKYLSFTDDNKAICLNYQNRPEECRDFLCKKARQSIMVAEAKEREQSAGMLRNPIEQGLEKIQEEVF